MGTQSHRSFLRRFLIGLALFLGFVVCLLVVGRVASHWRVNWQIARFERCPSQTGADALVSALRSHSATADQGRRILTLLLRPQVVTRHSYPAGRTVGIALEWPFPLRFQDTLWHHEHTWVHGAELYVRSGPSDAKPTTLCARALSEFEATPGTHEVKIRCTCAVAFERRDALSTVEHYLRKLAPALRIPVPSAWQPARAYECDFEMPTQVVVVPEAAAETMKLISSAELAPAMRAALSVESSASCRYTLYDAPAGPLLGGFEREIVYKDLPVAVAFRLELHLSNGSGSEVVRSYPRPLRARAGSSGHFAIAPADLSLEEPGTYTGTLVLTPDPDCAFEDPAIEAIWNHGVELPISFKVSKVQRSPPR